MANERRIELGRMLAEILGNSNIYYQPPSNVQMSYPCIKYSKLKPSTTNANNKKYTVTNCYEIIVIDRKPDNPAIDKLMELPYCSFDRHYTADNLNHDVLNIYY